MKPKRRYWIIYTDRKRLWLVQGKAANGRIIFASSKGYSTKRSAALNAAKHGAPVGLLSRAAPGVRVEQWV